MINDHRLQECFSLSLNLNQTLRVLLDRLLLVVLCLVFLSSSCNLKVESTEALQLSLKDLAILLQPFLGFDQLILAFFSQLIESIDTAQGRDFILGVHSILFVLGYLFYQGGFLFAMLLFAYFASLFYLSNSIDFSQKMQL